MPKRKVAALAVVSLALIMVVVGIYRNEVTDVFNKAIRICLECIGIGWLLW